MSELAERQLQNAERLLQKARRGYELGSNSQQDVLDKEVFEAQAEFKVADYTAMKNKDFETVVDMMPDSEKASKEDKDGAIEMMKLFDGFSGGVKDYEIVSEEISNDGKTATVRVKVTYGTGEVEEENTHLVKDGKAWRPASQN